MSTLASRDNPRVKRWTRLAQDARYRREEKRALIEGPHLLAAALEHGLKPIALLTTEGAGAEIAALVARSGVKPVMLTERVLRGIVDAESPPGVAAEIALPGMAARGVRRAVFLEGVQDPGNVGAIIRSAAAFGIDQVVLDRACADPWSPRALRAGMGGHFALAIEQHAELGPVLSAFGGTIACAVPSGGMPLRQTQLAGKIGWVFGGEGAGLTPETLGRASVKVAIPMAVGTESLNVAAAAAICLYELFSRPGAGS